MAGKAQTPDLQSITLEVEGVSRTALLYVPPGAKEKSAPLVFVYHGHGGNSAAAARSFAMHRHWPEAIAVYPQGLPTPGRLTDPEGKKAGWQSRPGDQGNRDLAFFDALLAKIKSDDKVDDKRIYCTGHSNGGGFTYLLWAVRGESFAAVAPSSAARARSEKGAALLKPKPAMHLAGKADPLVKFEWQEASMDAVRRINGCAATGNPWAENCLLYASESGNDFVSYIHPGGHRFAEEAVPLIVRFFKEHPAPE
jgi:polyhydroxybutyrate depolymerase